MSLKQLSFSPNSEEHESEELASEEHASEEHASEEHASEEHASGEHASGEHASEEHASGERTSEEHAKEEHASEEHASEEHASGEHASEEHASEEHASGEHASEEHASGEHASGEHASEEYASEEHASEEHEKYESVCTEEETMICLKYSFSHDIFRRHIVQHVLKDSIDRLKVLEVTLPYPSFDWKQLQQDWKDKLDSYTKGTGLVYPKFHEYCMNPLWKMQRDQNLLDTVLKTTLNELENEECFNASFLNSIRDDFKKFKDAITDIEAHRDEMKQAVLDLKANIRELCQKNKEMETAEDEIVFEDEILLDETIKCKAEERYVKNWEEARVYQNQLKLKFKEQALSKNMITTMNLIDRQLRANAEIEMYILNETSELDHVFHDWSNKYDQDIEKLDLELLQLNTEKESVENELKALVLRYQQENDEMDDFKTFLGNIEEEKALRTKQNEAASKMQQWWLKYKNVKEALQKPKAQKQKKNKKGGKNIKSAK